MEEHQNTEPNDNNQDSAQQSNNGFEVLSNDNSNSADRKDDLRKSNDSLPSQEANSKRAYSEVATEEEQQSPSKNEQPSDASPTNTESVTQINTENISPVTNTEEVNLIEAESGSPKKFDDSTHHDHHVTIENNPEETQPLAEPHQEHQQQELPVQSQEETKTESPKKPLRDSSSSPLKERKPVYAPTFAVNPNEQEHQPENKQQPHHSHEQPQLTVSVNQQHLHNVQQHQGYQQPVFLPILDVCMEYQRGNFLPIIHCLEYNLVPREYLDGSGYNVLHHAISYNNGDVVLLLFDHFKMDVNLRSGSNQTCVMIASNFGFIELIKMTLDHGGRINDQDNTRFTAALYCIKQGNVVSLLYLMARGADLNIPDNNGCTAVHWAAYKNNVFLLRLFRRLGMDMNGVDLAGLTPLQRAIASEGAHAVHYLLEDLNVPIPQGVQVDAILNQKIRELVAKHVPHPKDFIEKAKHDALTAFKSAPQLFTFGFYAIYMILGLCFYYFGVIEPSRESYVFHLIFFVFVLYFLAYAYWYYLKSADMIPKIKNFAYEKLGGGHDSTNTSTIIDSSFEQTARSPYRQDYLDTLIARGNHKLYETKENTSYPYPSFLHEVFSDVEKGDFAKVALFDERLYCPTTLLPKKQKSKFCKQTHSVVEGFNHYSYTLAAPINQSNHPFYLALLVQQTLLLFLFIFANIYAYNDERANSIIVLIPETIYFVAKRAGVLAAIYLAASTILLGYSLFFMTVELYCVARNLTYNELFNSHRYPYLYRINQHAAPGMQMIKVFYNPNNKGVVKNIKEYVMRLVQ